MKCDHIRTRQQGDTPFFPNMLNNATVEVCLKEDVDAVIAELKSESDKVIAEKDREIAELKKKLMPCLNGDCILTCEVVEKYGKENAELKKKLEDVQASAYTDSVDAGMRERRLRRALYKACANWAHFVVAFFSSYATKEKWHKMERKCLNKMEEYK